MVTSDPVVKVDHAWAGAAPRTRPAVARPRAYAFSDDAVLVAACLQGDDLAWDQLVERYSPLVYSLPRRMGLQAAHADEMRFDRCANRARLR